jgi:hypothetical protein
MYSQTLPFYICQQWGTQCVAGCNGDNTCSDSCRYVILSPLLQDTDNIQSEPPLRCPVALPRQRVSLYLLVLDPRPDRVRHKQPSRHWLR